MCSPQSSMHLYTIYHVTGNLAHKLKNTENVLNRYVMRETGIEVVLYTTYKITKTGVMRKTISLRE